MEFHVGRSERGDHLYKVVARHLSVGGDNRSATAVRKLVTGGSVRIGGRVERNPTTEVTPGQAVVVRLTPARARRHPAAVSVGESAICFEDDVLIVVDKPAGLPTHATIDPRRAHLHGALRELLARRTGADSSTEQPPYLGIHHRLDRDTTGVVLFTKDRRINAAIGALFAERRMDKAYLAVVAGRRPVQERWTVRDHLARISPADEAARYGQVRSGGQSAHTDLELVGPVGQADGWGGQGQGRWLVRARPRTGRTHQVRVHLAGSGLAIVGDELYGGPPAPTMLLHAESLRFRHPLTGEELVVTAPAPAALRPSQD